MHVDLSEVSEWISAYQAIPDLFVVDIRLEDDGETLVVEADCPANISSDQCGALSAYISAKLDAAGHDMSLIVSSPGLTTPLRHARQFQKNLGETVIVKEGMVKWEGKLIALTPEHFTIEFELKERVDGKKRPVQVRHTKEFPIRGAHEVTIKLGKR